MQNRRTAKECKEYNKIRQEVISEAEILVGQIDTAEYYTYLGDSFNSHFQDLAFNWDTAHIIGRANNLFTTIAAIERMKNILERADRVPLSGTID